MKNRIETIDNCVKSMDETVVRIKALYGSGRPSEALQGSSRDDIVKYILTYLMPLKLETGAFRAMYEVLGTALEELRNELTENENMVNDVWEDYKDKFIS